MARTLNEAPDKMYVGLEVTHIQRAAEPDKVTWRWVGPYSTPAAAKGQMSQRDWYDLYENIWQQHGVPIGRARVDRLVLEAELNWTPVK